MAKQPPHNALHTWKSGDVLRRRYEIKGLLGQGGMGAVYHAYDTLRQRPIAIKQLHEHLTPDTSQRLLQELALQERIDHPGVVRTYDADLDPDTGAIFFTMALLQGPSLAQLLQAMHQSQQHPPFSLAQVSSLLERLGEILDAVHQKDILHGDLKPSHILFAPTDETPLWSHQEPLGPAECAAWLDAPMRLIDFGLARPITWSVLPTGGAGTPPMMAPEQWQPDGPLGPATDVYALGLVLYQLLTGAPHVGGQLPPPSVWLKSHGHPLRHVDDIAKLGAQTELRPINDALDAVVAKALAYLPQDRYQSARELDLAFQESLGLLKEQRQDTSSSSDQGVGVVSSRQDAAETRYASEKDPQQTDAVMASVDEAPPALSQKLTASDIHQRMGQGKGQQRLALSEQLLGVDALEALSGYPGLRHLSLCQVGLTDNGLIYLASLERLESLQCTQNLLTGQGLIHLQELSHLQMLSLSENPLEAQHLAMLSQFKGLKWLSLWRCPIGQQNATRQLASLGQLPHLRTLHLSETGLCDADLSALTQLAQLQELHLHGNPDLSQDAVKRLELALPRCDIRS